MAKYLYGASIQGIQEYIYATNKLQEIIGASEIIDSLGQKFDGKKDYGEIYAVFDKLRENDLVEQILLNAAGNFRAIVDGEENLKKIVVGFDFRFGRNRAWDKYDLERIFDGEVVVVDEVCYDGMGVHSSAIREFIKQGKIKEANKLLGREYSIEGNVIKGQGIGAKELVATLNLDIKSYLLPREGVYATRTRMGSYTYGSVTFIGTRVSTDGNFSVETHILDENTPKVTKHVAVCFVKRIRDNEKFANLSELKEQIKCDIAEARKSVGVCDLYCDETIKYFDGSGAGI